MTRRESPPKDQQIVVAYGFDKAGLSTPPAALQRPAYRIEWVPYEGPDVPHNATGIMFPAGIFERVQYTSTWQGYRAADVSCDLGKLLAVERQVANLLRAGGWVVVLAGDMTDEFPTGDGYLTFRSEDTDLAKRLLGGIGRTRFPEGTGVVSSKRDEFAPYIRQWGVARNFFKPGPAARVLATAGQNVVGFELDARLFVLPFLSTNTSAAQVTDLAETLVLGVLDYRRKMLVELPAWVHDFQFAVEEKLRVDVTALRERLLELESSIKSFEEYKLILVSSGVILKDALVDILAGFFGLDVDPLDEGREDFKIVDNAKVPVAVGEAKGTNGGIKREHINQVDSHRERLGLNDDVPGLLLINNQMDVAGIAKRQETQVALEQVRHARNLNVLVVRTIDLLYLMRHLEAEPDRRDKFLGLLRSGGGWISAGPSGYELLTG